MGTIISQAISFDRDKSERNASERGLPFILALEFQWETALVAEDNRCDYGETRICAIGYIATKLHVMVFTPRSGRVHVISLRRANRRERNRYAAQTKT